jgi:predicted Rossmann-fold nucleotide-binding protein
MNITVYLGASVGNDPAFLPAVQQLGTWIGSNGHALVYGGSKSGLMGALADSVLDAGGHVTGVEPSFLSRPSFSTMVSTT